MPKCVQPYLSSISGLANCRNILLGILITILVCVVVSSLLLGMNIITTDIPDRVRPQLYIALGISLVLSVLGIVQFIVFKLMDACASKSAKSFNRCLNIQQHICTKFDNVAKNIETSKIEVQVLASRIDCISS